MWTVTYQPKGLKEDAAPETPSSDGSFGNITTGPGWYVAWIDGEYDNCIPLTFARKSDADRARHCIVSERDWSGTTDDIFEQMKQLGFKHLRKIMTEHLAW